MVFVTFLGVALLASYFAAQTGRQTDQAVAQPGKSRSFMRSDRTANLNPLRDCHSLCAFLRDHVGETAMTPRQFLRAKMNSTIA
jgi:hypothetical protein